MGERTNELLGGLAAGDAAAFSAVVARYTERLLALAQSRLSPKLQGRIDPKDVVQSAFRSFFRVTRRTEHVPTTGDALWRMLAAITVHKVLRQAERNRAGRRATEREEPLRGSSMGGRHDAYDREPTPEEAAIVTEELTEALRILGPLHRQMIELVLQGHDVPAIAVTTERSERMVRYVVRRFRECLTQRLSAVAEG